MRRTIIALMVATSLIVFAYSVGHTQPTPIISGNFCVNARTGAMRNQLIKNGIVQACHKGELLAAIINFDSAPTPNSTASPQPSSTPTADPTASASPTPTATPSPQAQQCSGCYVDANGTEIGPTLGTNDAFAETVMLKINGVAMGVPISQQGFVDEGGGTLFYQSADCTGQAYVAVGINATQPYNPIIEVDDGLTAPFTAGSVVWYAQTPLQTFTANSQEGFADPSNPATGVGCYTGNGPQTIQAGLPAHFDLNGLGFVPPFMAQ